MRDFLIVSQFILLIANIFAVTLGSINLYLSKKNKKDIDDIKWRLGL